jgi:membrane protein DedA with SNARE-associated domain
MSEIGTAAAWVLDVIARLGYVGLAALVALETVVPPLPSEVVLPLAGFLCGRGDLIFVAAVGAATAGSVLGATLLYWLAWALGERRLRALIARHGKWILISESDLDAALVWFRQHGRSSVFFGRLVPAVRSYISIPAGIVRMPLTEFLVATTLGSGLWNTVLIGAGWLLGDRWDAVVPQLERFGSAVLIVIGLAVAGFVVWRLAGRFGNAAKRA